MCILRVGPFSPNFMIFYLLEVYPPPKLQRAYYLPPTIRHYLLRRLCCSLNWYCCSLALHSLPHYVMEVVVVVARLDHLGYQLKEDVMEGVRSEGVHCMYLTSSPVHRKVMTVLCNLAASSQVW